MKLNQLLFKFLFVFILCGFAVNVIAQPTLTAPANSAHGVSQTPTFIWTATTGPYTLDIYSDSLITSVYHETGIVGTSRIYPGSPLTVSKKYWWRITDNTSAVSSAFSFYTILGPPTATAATSIGVNQFNANWSTDTGATGYLVRIGTTSGGTDIANDQNVGNVLTFQKTGLTAGTTYYYSVKAYDGVDTSASSNQITVTTLSGTFSGIAPINGLTGVSVLPTFLWNDNFDETTYTINISTAGSSQAAFNAAVIATKVTAQNATSWATSAADLGLPLSNGTTYYWQISIQGGSANGDSSSIFHFTTVPVTIPLTLSTPANNTEVFSQAVTFQWSFAFPTTTLKFIVQYKFASSAPAGPEDEAFWSGANFTSLPATTNLFSPVQTVLYGKTYYWRVLVQNTTAPNDYVYYPLANVYGKFTTAGTAAVTIIPTWPSGGNKVYTNSPTFSWYINQDVYGLKYQVKYSTSNAVDGGGRLTSGTKYPVVDDSINTQGSSNFYLDLSSVPITLTPGTPYYWQVRAYFASGDTNSNPADDTVGWSAWSSVANFVTGGSGTPIQPIVNYPIDTVTIYTTAPVLFWHLTDVGTGLVYDVQISDSSNFADTVWSVTTPIANVFNSSGATPPSLTPGKTYYWRVRSNNNAGGLSAWSENTPIVHGAFTVAGGLTNSYPILSWPIGSPVLFTTQPKLLWYLEGPSLGVSGYVVKYKSTAPPADWSGFTHASPSDTAGGDTTLSGYTNTSYQIWNILPYTGHYFWAVATIEGSGANVNYRSDDFFIEATSGAPIQSQPVNGGTVYSDTVNISWYVNGPTNGIAHYNIQYSNTDVFTPFTSAVVDTPAQNLTLTGLTVGATYYWRVQAQYIDGSLSNWSSWSSFNIQVGSPKVVQPVVGGPNNVTINTGSPMFSWFLPTQGDNGVQYQVEYADNAGFSNSKIISDLSKPQLVVGGLNSNTKYYWRVRSKAEDGTYSYYSNTGKFNVDKNVTGIKKDNTIPKEFSVLQNYPNPFNPSTQIRFSIPKESIVSIRVYNMLGQLIKTLVDERKVAGNYSVQWNGDNNFGNLVASGVYIYRVVAGSNVAVKKMMLIK